MWQLPAQRELSLAIPRVQACAAQGREHVLRQEGLVVRTPAPFQGFAPALLLRGPIRVERVAARDVALAQPCYGPSFPRGRQPTSGPP